MMNVEGLEKRITEEKAALVKLEEAYEEEEDETKIFKLESKLKRKDEAINKLIDRQQDLLDKEDEDKDENAEEDEDVCPLCGGNLNQVGEENGAAIFECVECHELFLDE